MHRHIVREIPHDGAGPGITERDTCVLEGHTLNAARNIGFPVLAISLLLFLGCEVVPPAQLLQQGMVEFRVAGRDFAAHRVRPVTGEQVDPIALDTISSPEGTTAIHHMLGSVVEVGSTRMLDLVRAPARPWQAKIIAGQVVTGLGILAAGRTQGSRVEDLHVAHMRLQAFRRLTGVADRPRSAVDLTQHVFEVGFRQTALARFQPDILGAIFLADELVGEAELLRKLIHDHVIRTRIEQRLDHLLAPLDRAVRRGDAAVGFELRRCGQQIGAILARHREHRCRS